MTCPLQCCPISIIFIIALSTLIGYIAKRYVSNKTASLYIGEFLGQMCSGVFLMEIGIIAKKYTAPSIPLSAAIFIHFLLRNMHFIYNKLYDSPTTFLSIYYAQGRKVTATFVDICAVISTQIVGLWTGQVIARYIWRFLDTNHVDAIKVGCETSLSASHSWEYAALLEGAGVFILVLISVVTPEKFQPVTLAAAATVMVTLFSHVSGQFMNPVVAAVFSFNCKGHPKDWKFSIVYVAAPVIGNVLAWESWLGVKKYKQSKEKSE